MSSCTPKTFHVEMNCVVGSALLCELKTSQHGKCSAWSPTDLQHVPPLCTYALHVGTELHMAAQPTASKFRSGLGSTWSAAEPVVKPRP